MAVHSSAFATDSMPERLKLTQELEQFYKRQQEAEQTAQSRTSPAPKDEKAKQGQH